MEFKDKKHDKDSSLDVWENLYKKIYKNQKPFSGCFNFNVLKDTGTGTRKNDYLDKRWYIMLHKNIELYKEFPQFKIAGDCDFNFNESKVKLFKKIVGNHELLDVCSHNHHELWNFSFMPITGAMNNTKGIKLRAEENDERDSWCLDRLDVFLMKLNLYYQNGDTSILSYREGNRKALIWYLSLFKDVYDYCEKVYLITNKKFVDKMIISGSKVITKKTPQNALAYMALALEYWELKKQALRKYKIIP